VFDSAGRHLAVGTANGFIELYDFKSQSTKRKLFKIQPTSGSVNCISWSKNDRYIATGNSNGSIILFNTVINQMSKPWLHPTKSSALSNVTNGNGNTSFNSVTAMQYSIINTYILGAAYEDGTVVLWDVNKDLATCHFKSHNFGCNALVLSPLNYILMISGGLDGLITLYDTTAKKQIKTITCNTGIASLDLHKNGSTLCVGTVNGFINMFDLRHKTDEPYSSIRAHENMVHSVKFIQNFNQNSINTSNNFEATLSIRSVNTSNQSNNFQSESMEISPSPVQIKKSSSYNLDLQRSMQQPTNGQTLGALNYGNLGCFVIYILKKTIIILH
jgi:WD40 repeat protein